MAANAIGLRGAERVLTTHNHRAQVLGFHSIRIVRDIEQQKSPQAVL